MAKQANGFLCVLFSDVVSHKYFLTSVRCCAKIVTKHDLTLVASLKCIYLK